jgi:hypothetical protein
MGLCDWGGRARFCFYARCFISSTVDSEELALSKDRCGDNAGRFDARENRYRKMYQTEGIKVMC